MDDREFWLATTLVELADISGDEATYCGLLAARMGDLLAPAEIGVLMADGSGTLKAVAASTERASRMTSLYADRDKGLAVGCHGSGRPVLIESLEEAGERWPRFAADARAAGFGTVVVLPVRRRDTTIGVVGVLASPGHRIDASQIRLAQVLAEAAAVAILQLRALRDSVEAARQLREALASRIFVEQAKGALAARLDITPEAAFVLLRDFARRNGVLLAKVAGATIRGELTARELLAGRRQLPPLSRADVAEGVPGAPDRLRPRAPLARSEPVAGNPPARLPHSCSPPGQPPESTIQWLERAEPSFPHGGFNCLRR